MQRARRQPNRFRSLVRIAVAVGPVLLVMLAGCGAETPRAARPAAVDAFLADGRGSVPADLEDGARLAGRFARVYARHAYEHRVPRVRGESEPVRRAIAAAAARVPAARRRLRPRILGVHLALSPGGGALVATARIGDGRFRPFTIAFAVTPTGATWLVTSISLPG